MTLNINKFNIGSDFVTKAANAIKNYILGCDRGEIKIALSGGNSPKAVYEKLANFKEIDWSKVTFYQVDERWVKPDSPDSNAKMIEESLVIKLPKLKAFHKFDTGQSIENGLEAYEQKIKLLSSPLFHLVILGLGSDGHTASLFPHGPELEELEKMVVHSKSPSGVVDRATLTFPAIMNASKLIFLVRGSEKKEMVEKWLNSNASEYEIPAKIALEHQDADLYYDYS